MSYKNGPSSLESTVPIVTDNCGLYGTFYVDLMGSGLKTFNSPGRRPKMPHGVPHPQGGETIQIFTQPMAKTAAYGSLEALPWKQAIRPQPRMGVLRESWEKNHSKQGNEAHSRFFLCSPLLVLSSGPLSTSCHLQHQHRISRTFTVPPLYVSKSYQSALMALPRKHLT